MFFVLIDGGRGVRPVTTGGGQIAIGERLELGSRAAGHVLATAGDDGSVQLVWTEESDNGIEFWFRGAHAPPEPAKICAADGRVLAINLNPFPASRAPEAHVLLAVDKRHLRYLRISLQPGGKPSIQELEAPEEPVQQWAITGEELTDLVVVCHDGEDLLYRYAAEKSEWETLAAAGEVRHLQLYGTPRKYWAAAWMEPGLGPRFAESPDFVR